MSVLPSAPKKLLLIPPRVRHNTPIPAVPYNDEEETNMINPREPNTIDESAREPNTEFTQEAEEAEEADREPNTEGFREPNTEMI